MSVIKDMTPPTGTSPLIDMAARYEAAWNEVVMEQPQWKQKAIINNFEVISGKHVYHDESDHRMMHDIVKEAVRRAERKD